MKTKSSKGSERVDERIGLEGRGNGCFEENEVWESIRTGWYYNGNVEIRMSGDGYCAAGLYSSDRLLSI